MIRVDFLGPIQEDSLELDISNLSELAALLQKNPKMRTWLTNSAVAVNDTLVCTLDFPLHDNDVVSLLPPVCGG